MVARAYQIEFTKVVNSWTNLANDDQLGDLSRWAATARIDPRAGADLVNPTNPFIYQCKSGAILITFVVIDQFGVIRVNSVD
jgi:hypothetical protein